MGQKTTYEKKLAKPIDISLPENKDIIYSIPIENIDECLNGLFPDSIPKTLRDSLIKKMCVIKYAKKVIKEVSCFEFKNNHENINGNRYYLSFISIKNKDNTVTLAYFFLYEKRGIEKSYIEKKKGDTIISKSYLDELEEVNKLIGAEQSKEFLEKMSNKWIEAKKELNLSDL